MNQGQFKDTLCCLCLPETVVACWFLTQEIAGSNTLLTKISYKVYRFCRFREFRENSVALWTANSVLAGHKNGTRPCETMDLIGQFPSKRYRSFVTSAHARGKILVITFFLFSYHAYEFNYEQKEEQLGFNSIPEDE